MFWPGFRAVASPLLSSIQATHRSRGIDLSVFRRWHAPQPIKFLSFESSQFFLCIKSHIFKLLTPFRSKILRGTLLLFLCKTQPLQHFIRKLWCEIRLFLHAPRSLSKTSVGFQSPSDLSLPIPSVAPSSPLCNHRAVWSDLFPSSNLRWTISCKLSDPHWPFWAVSSDLISPSSFRPYLISFVSNASSSAPALPVFRARHRRISTDQCLFSNSRRSLTYSRDREHSSTSLASLAFTRQSSCRWLTHLMIGAQYESFSLQSFCGRSAISFTGFLDSARSSSAFVVRGLSPSSSSGQDPTSH